MKSYKSTPSLGHLLGNAAGWCSVFTILFFVTFPLWARPLLRVLGAVLGALNDFGSGY